METIVLDGKRFVKAAVAAKRAGYTSDYVGQLCRSGKISAQLVGRSWYVNEDELGTHRTEKKRNSRLKAREQVRKALKERKESPERHLKIQTGKHFERHSLNYEEDAHDLMPEVKKVSISSERKLERKPIEEVEDDGVGYEIENEGDKVVMSGSVDVVDATDEDLLDENIVVLQAEIEEIKKTSKKKKPAKKKVVKEAPKEEQSVAVTVDSDPQRTDFLQKLDALEADLAAHTEKSTQVETEDTEEAQIDVQSDDVDDVEPLEENEIPIESYNEEEVETSTVTKSSIFSVRLALTAAAILLVSLSVTLESYWSYNSEPEAGSGTYFETSFSIDAETVIAQIPFIN